jgi:class III poly(R)-hydroxyalkanoic acid synthase PhaE subunit
MDEGRSTGAGDWLDAQQKYWDAWLELTRRTLAAPEGEAAVGADAVRQWWEAASRAAPEPVRELFGRLVDMSAPYFDMARVLARDGARDGAAVLDAWRAGMRAATPGGTDAAASPGGAFGGLPFDALAHVLAALWPLPGNPWQAAETDALAHVHARLKDNAERLLSMPAIGYHREAQEQYQGVARLMLAYAQALQEYNLGFARLAERSAANAARRLEAAGAHARVESLRQLYDLWVDACEEEYAAYAMSEDHARRYGRLVNALAALKHRITELLDETLDVVNLPTRREIDALQRRMQEARRAEAGLRAELARLERQQRAPGARVRRR